MNRDHFSKIFLASMMILAFAFVGCSDDDDGGTAPVPVDEFALVAPVTDAYLSTYLPRDNAEHQLGINITAEQLFDAYIDTNSNAPNTADFFVIDWRSDTAYGNAHIDGAVNWVLGGEVNIIDHVDAGDIPMDKTIVNVCYTGQTASTATAILGLLGYDAVNLKFGMCGWTARTDYSSKDYMAATSDDYAEWLNTIPEDKGEAGGYPALETGGKSAYDIIKARAEMYVTGQLNQEGGPGWHFVMVNGESGIYDAINNDEWYVVNYFPADPNYDAGHIPGAMQYSPNASLLTSSTLNTLPTDGTPVGVYCWTGQTSAQVTVTLNMLGYNAYSIGYGVQALCYSNTTINDHAYTYPTTSYPCVGTGVGM